MITLGSWKHPESALQIRMFKQTNCAIKSYGLSFVVLPAILLIEFLKNKFSINIVKSSRITS